MKTSEVTQNRLKKEDHKALKSFVVIMLISMIVGGFAGYGAGRLSRLEVNIKEILDGFSSTLIYILPTVHVIAAALTGVFCSLCLCKVRKMYDGWDGEEEETDREMDRKMGICLILSNFLTVLNMVLYMTELHMWEKAELEKKPFLIFAIVFLVIFVGVCVEIVLIQKKVIDRSKLINPEKRGSVFDMKFAKKWEESCDEAEQMRIYKASYKAFQTTQTACMLCMLIGLLCDVAIDTGLLPIIFIAAIWLCSMISYFRAARKLEAY